ncbi:unnamed protein product [Clavelina lepadiformis]|uniref:Uncharacterized protein n=1 Tax=Clavelina lepadiformis TaxID=159417 RepID=A0ABP0GJE3_CLALP
MSNKGRTGRKKPIFANVFILKKLDVLSIANISFDDVVNHFELVVAATRQEDDGNNHCDGSDQGHDI